MKWDAVIFDVDGVLTWRTTSEAQTAAMVQAVRQYLHLPGDLSIEGIPRHGRTDQQVLLDLLERGGEEASEVPQELRDLYAAAYEPGPEDSVLRENADIVLQDLAARAAKLAVASGNLMPVLNKKLARMGLGDMFWAIGSGEIGQERWQILDAVRSWLGHGDGPIIYVCDTWQDVIAGHRVGLKCALMPSSETREGEWLAEAVVGDWEALYRWLVTA